MQVNIYGYDKNRKMVAHIKGELDQDQLLDMSVSPKAYLNVHHPSAKQRGVVFALASIEADYVPQSA